jgi:galactokinase
MKEIKSIHQLEFNSSATYVVTLPTLYTLIGEFGEYCKGYSLFGATNETLSVAISKREDLSSRLYLKNNNERKRFTYLNIKYKKEDRWANLIKGVVATLISRSYTIGGFNLTLQGKLLDESSPTVDAAITLATTIALQKLFNLDLVLKECATISYSALTSFSSIKSSLTFFNALINIDSSSVILYDLSTYTFKKITYPFIDEKIKSLIVDANVATLPFIQEIEEKEKAASVAFEKLKLAYPKTSLREISVEQHNVLNSFVPLRCRFFYQGSQ